MKPVPFSPVDIEKALSVKPITGIDLKNTLFSKISTDSRNIQKDELFVALKGANFNGEDFITPLFLNGVKGFVANKGFLKKLPETVQNDFKSKENGAFLFETDDTLKALGLLAKYQRLRCKAKLIAITGSNGKTTTRKLVGEILKRSFNILTTKGNFNNEIGLPLTLLGLSSDHDWAVVEMGMNRTGEISRLANIAQPDIGIITNTSSAHLEELKTIENVAFAKAEMFQHMNSNSTVIINSDDPRFTILESKAQENQKIDEIICFGTNANADIRADAITRDNKKTKFSILQKNKRNIDVILNSPAPFMVTNAIAATAIPLNAGMDQNSIKEGIKAFTPVSGRMNFIKLSNKINLIDDTYNANPGSVEQALITLSHVAGKNTSIAVLGDMLELGIDAEKLHRRTGKIAAENKISKIYTYGDLAANITKGAVNTGFLKQDTMSGTREEIAESIIKKFGSTISWILVKGSRGMRMEKVIQKMQQLVNNNNKAD